MDANIAMFQPLHHHLIHARLDDLRPTQITVGFAEVEAKRREWRLLKKKERKRLVAQHWFPSVIGPHGGHYIVDHHHLGLALHLERQGKVWLLILRDLSMIDGRTFWRVMEYHQWAHPYDERGSRTTYDEIPRTVAELRDDPYRSLSGLVRRAGGYAKDVTPFAEFLWADFFRTRITKAELMPGITRCVRRCVTLARSQHARYLPGWTGSAAS